MSTSLFAGLSGLRSFETYLNVIGNNIANANTTGFRGSRVNFGDLLAVSVGSAAAPTSTTGGKNPQQIGLGVRVKSIDVSTRAGSLVATNRNLDLTIFGPGMFMVNDGTRNLFTRSGTFGFDAQGQLVELGTGYLVQSATGGSIVVPPNAISPPQATSQVEVKGNLPAQMTGPLPEILTSSNPFQTGTAAAITGTQVQPFTFADGDSITIQVDGGTPQTITFTAAAFTAIGANIASATAAEVAQVINSQLTGATASAAGGALVLTSDTLGSASKLKVSDVTGNPAVTLGLSTVLTTGTQSAADGTTDLNDLVTNVTDYVNGDGIDVAGALMDGTEFAATFTYGVDGTTLEDLRAFIDNLVTDASVELDAQGNLVLTADAAGAAQYALTIEDAAGSTGSSNFSALAMNATQNGTDPDEVTTSITVYDTNGQAHLVNLVMQRVDADTWTLRATLPEGDGTVVDGTIGGIRFSSDGSLANVGGPGDEDPDIEIQFQTGLQTIAIDLGTPGEIDGLTHFGGTATAQATFQDGFANGTLADVVVTNGGEVTGLFSNGQNRVYGVIALASFANPAGLKQEGSNFFSASANSGNPLVGAPGGSGGTIQSGALEASNVELAEEFVRMIEAQRGYQASARVIRTTQELLQSLLQNI